MARQPFVVSENLFKPKAKYDLPTPFTAAELKRTEKALGVKLPAAYVEVLKVRNGGSLRLTTFTMKQRPPKRIEHFRSREYHVGELPGIDPTHHQALTQRAALAHAEWEVDEGLFPLDGDGHYWLCLDYRKCGPRGEPAVTHWEQGDPRVDAPDPSNPTCVVAASFEELILGLRRARDAYEPATIAIDDEKLRGRLGTILTSLGCKKHKYVGVKSKDPLPPTWHWHKYKSFVRGNPGWLTLEKNKTYGYAPKFDERPGGHPMLRVSVAPKQADQCLAELTAALGEKAVLLQGVV